MLEYATGWHTAAMMRDMEQLDGAFRRKCDQLYRLQATLSALTTY
jgi:hypothetical protein